MKQIKIIVVNLGGKYLDAELRELRESIEDNWIVADKSVLHEAVIYIMAKVPEEMIRGMQAQTEKKTLSNLLR